MLCTGVAARILKFLVVGVVASSFVAGCAGGRATLDDVARAAMNEAWQGRTLSDEALNLPLRNSDQYVQVSRDIDDPSGSAARLIDDVTAPYVAESEDEARAAAEPACRMYEAAEAYTGTPDEQVEYAAGRLFDTPPSQEAKGLAEDLVVAASKGEWGKAAIVIFCAYVSS